MTQTDDLERRVWVYNVRKLHWPRMSEDFLADTVDSVLLNYSSCAPSVLFSVLRDQLASVGTCAADALFLCGS